MFEDQFTSRNIVASDAMFADGVSGGNQARLRNTLPAQEAHFRTGRLFCYFTKKDVFGGQWTWSDSIHHDFTISRHFSGS
jgi:hypothetical protein